MITINGLDSDVFNDRTPVDFTSLPSAASNNGVVRRCNPLVAGQEDFYVVSNGTSWLPYHTKNRPFMDLTYARKVQAAPVTITSNATNTSATAPLLWPATNFASGTSNVLTGGNFTYTRCGKNVRPYSATGTTLVTADTIQWTTTPTYNRLEFGVRFYHTGRYLDIKTANGLMMVKVDGEYTSLTPIAITGILYNYIDFGSVATRLVEVVLTSGLFGGVYTGATDTISSAPAKGPKTVIVGDSFSGGTGTSAEMGLRGAFPAWFADLIGWDDVIVSGIGSTGYLADASGVATTYRQRVQHDVIDNAPDVIVFTGGYNDRAQTGAAIYAEACLLFKQVRDALPFAEVIVFSPFWYKGCTSFKSAAADIIPIRDALRDAAALYSCHFCDMLEMDLPIGTPLAAAGLLTSNITAGATTFVADTLFAVPGTVTIGTDRVRYSSVSGTGPFTYTLQSAGTIYQAHSIGDAVTPVGNSFWTGTGNAAVPTGIGNCDLITTSAVDIHPTDTGHRMIGEYVAKRLHEILSQ
ncbi:MAG: SGNH/GDSL hydrolase family protein [Melioribacteraceae bacterium]